MLSRSVSTGSDAFAIMLTLRESMPPAEKREGRIREDPGAALSPATVEAGSSVGHQAGRELAQGLVLDLADALAGQAKGLADLLEGLGRGVVQAEPHAEHGGL